MVDFPHVCRTNLLLLVKIPVSLIVHRSPTIGGWHRVGVVPTLIFDGNVSISDIGEIEHHPPRILVKDNGVPPVIVAGKGAEVASSATAPRVD